MKKYIVHTHVGREYTVAVSPEKAINNVRFRLFGRKNIATQYWEVEEVK